jgi:hypothetical protein
MHAEKGLTLKSMTAVHGKKKEKAIAPLSDSYPAFFLPIATTSNKNF